MTRKPDLPPGDDGRTIAGMNVEGMPWYNPRKDVQLGREEGGSAAQGQPMTKEEARYYTWGAMKAALAVAAVMCGALVLFVLFCQFVWFR